MVKFLINRPIAVLISTLALIIFSVLSVMDLPISLLPSLDVPSLVIRVASPNTSAREIENNILKPIRNNLLTLRNLDNLESISSNESGQIEIRFYFKTDMNIAFVDVNERIDRLLGILPKNMERPRVIRISSSDIPVVRIQIVPKSEAEMVETSVLVDKVIRKRIEQLDGISLVDVGGLQTEVISVRPDYNKMDAVNISENVLLDAIRDGNVTWGSINVKDGQYRYYVKVTSTISNPEDIVNLPVRTSNGTILSVGELAFVERVKQAPEGYHLFNEKEAIVVAVHKQDQAKMTELLPEIRASLDVFKKDYPELEFHLTQDQSSILLSGISNLKSALLFGGLFAIAILFVFMKNYRLAIIMGLSIPVCLLLSFIIFNVFGLSINVVSLSGLALGIGMLIDNAIIVLDNISIQRKLGNNLMDSCVQGVNQVMTPLISSVLTTLAVFIPLIFLHGISGALFFDQAVAVAAILSVSLLVSFILLPLFYKLFFSDKSSVEVDSKFFRYLKRIYGLSYNLIWRHKLMSFILLILLSGSVAWIGHNIPKSGMPEIESNELLLTVDWNESIGPGENKRRILEMNGEFGQYTQISESDIARLGYIFHNEESHPAWLQSYFQLKKDVDKQIFVRLLNKWFIKHYPGAEVSITDAPNAFDQLFISDEALIRTKIRNTDQLHSFDDIEKVIDNEYQSTMLQGPGFSRVTINHFTINNERLALYNVSRTEVVKALDRLFDDYNITTLKNYGEELHVRLVSSGTMNNQLDNIFIQNQDTSKYPLSAFVKSSLDMDFKHITSDKKGEYQSIFWQEATDPEKLINRVNSSLVSTNFVVDFDGGYFNNMENLRQLALVLTISLALLYFVLAAQFESLLQPVIILLTIPLGIAGSLLILYFTGTSLNIMSAIGIIVMLGIMVNDAILKVDTINRLVRGTDGQEKLEVSKAIHIASERRLKPILMTTITTILALLPVLFSGGLGADLQRPLVYSVIGGLSVGTLTAIYFVPLAYYYLTISKS